jgi:hypothetical protein
VRHLAEKENYNTVDFIINSVDFKKKKNHLFHFTAHSSFFLLDTKCNGERSKRDGLRISLKIFKLSFDV